MAVTEQISAPAEKAVDLVARGAPDHHEDAISVIARDRPGNISEVTSPEYDDRPVVARPAAALGLLGVPAEMADVTNTLDVWGTTRSTLERAPALSPTGHAVAGFALDGEGQDAPRLAVQLVDAVQRPRHRAGVGATDPEVLGLTVQQVRRHPVRTEAEPECSTRVGPGSVGVCRGDVPLRGSFAGTSEHSHRAAAPGLPRGLVRRLRRTGGADARRCAGNLRPHPPQRPALWAVPPQPG